MNIETPVRAATSDADLLLTADALAARRRRRRLTIFALLTIVAALALAYFLMARSDDAAAPADGAAATGKAGPGGAGGGRGAPVPVTVIVPGRTEVASVITATGTLAARRDQPVGVAGEGGLVTAVAADAGSWVGQGQVLARIDRQVQATQATQIQAQIAAARADAALAQSELDRSAALIARGFVSRADIDRKTAARDAARARVRVVEAQLAETRARIGRLDIRAPTAGLVLDRNVEVGQVVSAGSPALFRLARGGEMELVASVAQGDMARMRVGLPVVVTPVGTDRSFNGSVWQIAPVIDPATRQGEVRVAIPYDPAIRPGGFAEARITSGAVTAPLVPQSAVQADDKGNFVYVVDAKNEIVRREVQVGRVSNQGVSIAGGLSGQEQIVLSAAPFLTVGQKVTPQRQAAR